MTLTLLSTIKILVGFFTSIPVFRILSMQYAGQSLTTVSSRMWSWNPRRFLSIFRNRIPNFVFGRVDLEKRTVLVHLSDIVDICELSCNASVFTVMHKVFRHCRGATIGNQISPMLAGLTVSIEEEIYVRHLQSSFLDNKELFFCTRYVDNRLAVVPDDFLRIAGYSIS